MKLLPSFFGFSNIHAVLLMVSELSPRPGQSQYHDLSPSSTLGSLDIIVTSASIASLFVAAARAVTNPVMNSKPHVVL